MNQPIQERKSQTQDISVKDIIVGRDFIIAPKQIDTYIETQIVSISAEKVTQQPLIKASPYKGLKRFNFGDREYFFGRDTLIARLFKAVNKSSFSLVLGASGSGKSSVVRAGLIPELKKSLKSQKFYDFIFTPNQDPFQSLYRCLLNEEKDYQFNQSEAKIALKARPDTLSQVISKFKKKEERWLLFIDQFEQLFTICTDLEKRKNFVKGIVQVAKKRDSSVRIVLAMRSEFLEQFSFYPTLGAIANQNNIHLVTEMYPDELRQAIEQPAAKHGVVFEKGLVEQIIEEVEGQSGYLPLLQYTLNLLWERECRILGSDGRPHIEDRTLNKTSYAALGGVRGALQKRVDEIYKDICQKHKDGELATKQIFLKLVNIIDSDSGSRPVSRIAYRYEFVGEPVESILKRFIDENLLVSSYEYSSEEELLVGQRAKRIEHATIEIAHEILLSSWDKLKRWVEEEKEAIILKNWLAGETRRWLKVRAKDESKASDELLKGARLDQIVEFREKNAFEKLGGLVREENEYIDASVKFRYKQRRNRILGISIFSALFIGLLGIGGIASWQSRMAESRQKAADAVLRMRIDPEGSLLLATNAMDKYHTPQAESALRKALFESRIRAKIQISGQQHDDQTWMVAFSSDSKYVVATNMRKGTVKVLNIHTDELDSRTSLVEGNAFTNGDFVLTVSHDGNMRVWDVIKGEFIGDIRDDRLGEVTSAALSPDGKLVFINSGGNPGRIWNVKTGEVKNLNQTVGNVERAVFSPKNKFLVTVSRPDRHPDWKARLWNVKTGSFIRDLPGQISNYGSVGDVTIAQFSPDGNYIATTCGFGKPLGCYLFPAKYDIDGDGIPEVLGGYDLNGDGIAEFDGTVRIWKRVADTFELSHELSIKNRTYGLAFDSSSKLVATAGGDRVSRVWDANTGEQISNFALHTNWVWSAAFNSDSNLVVTTGSKDGTAKVWEARTGRELLVLPGHQRFAESAAFSPNDKFVLTIDDDGIAKVWDLNIGRPAKPSEQAYLENVTRTEERTQITNTLQASARQRLLQSSTEKWNAGVFSRDRKLLVTFNTREQSYTTAQVWRADTGELILPLREYKDGVRYATFSDDNEFVVLADGFGNTARVWEISTGREIDLIGHTGRVGTAAFSHNNACVVTASDHGEDGTARVWQTTTGEMMTILWGHTRGVDKVAFDPSGKSVITLSKDGKTNIYSSEGCSSIKDLRTLARIYIKKNARKH